ncbi:hypothetical protein Scep_030255 [Stephania cephalantha]|uniref:Uncharacterized protein n=1 Tax=Stephania cephalantha TaxID=152367 RepID=A0AAP0E6X4_9MAGN
MARAWRRAWWSTRQASSARPAAEQRGASGGQQRADSAVARCRLVGCAILTKSRRRDGGRIAKVAGHDWGSLTTSPRQQTVMEPWN